MCACVSVCGVCVCVCVCVVGYLVGWVTRVCGCVCGGGTEVKGRYMHGSPLPYSAPARNERGPEEWRMPSLMPPMWLWVVDWAQCAGPAMRVWEGGGWEVALPLETVSYKRTILRQSMARSVFVTSACSWWPSKCGAKGGGVGVGWTEVEQS